MERRSVSSEGPAQPIHRRMAGERGGRRPMRSLRCGELHPAVTHPAVDPNVHLQVLDLSAQSLACGEKRKHSRVTGCHGDQQDRGISGHVTRPSAHRSSRRPPAFPGRRGDAAPPPGRSALCTLPLTSDRPADPGPSRLKPAGQKNTEVRGHDRRSGGVSWRRSNTVIVCVTS